MKVKEGLEKEWEDAKAKNSDPYGHAVVIITEKIGRLLDEGLTPEDAEKYGIKDSGITGFQAGCMAQWIAYFHPRGEEFRRRWNLSNQINNEGELANKRCSRWPKLQGTVLNPALLTIQSKE